MKSQASKNTFNITPCNPNKINVSLRGPSAPAPPRVSNNKKGLMQISYNWVDPQWAWITTDVTQVNGSIDAQQWGTSCILKGCAGRWVGPAPDRAREGAGVAGSPVPHHGISSGGQQMASSPKLAICPSWITSLTRICHPPVPSGKAFPNELQRKCLWFVSVGAKNQHEGWYQLHRVDTASGHWWKRYESPLLVNPAVAVCNEGKVNISNQNSVTS